MIKEHTIFCLITFFWSLELKSFVNSKANTFWLSAQRLKNIPFQCYIFFFFIISVSIFHMKMQKSEKVCSVHWKCRKWHNLRKYECVNWITTTCQMKDFFIRGNEKKGIFANGKQFYSFFLSSCLILSKLTDMRQHVFPLFS